MITSSNQLWKTIPSKDCIYHWLDTKYESELSLSYEKIYELSQHIGYLLIIEHRLQAKDIVLLIYELSKYFIIIFLACIYSKIIPVCLYQNNLQNIKNIIHDCNPKMIMTSKS